MRRAGIVVGLAVTGVMAGAAPADAWYSHLQGCFKFPYDQCYDSQGQLYNPWVLVYTEMDVATNVPGVCAKAVTQAGNTKSGSDCAANTWGLAVNIAASPTSRSYGYWGDGGCLCWSARGFDVYARTA